MLGNDILFLTKVKVPVASDKQVRRFYKPSLKPRVGFSKQSPRVRTSSPRRVNHNYPRYDKVQPKRNFGRQSQSHGFPIYWKNFGNQSYMPWEMIPSFSHPNQLHQMQGMFNTNNFGPMRYWGPNV